MSSKQRPAFLFEGKKETTPPRRFHPEKIRIAREQREKKIRRENPCADDTDDRGGDEREKPRGSSLDRLKEILLSRTIGSEEKPAAPVVAELAVKANVAG